MSITDYLNLWPIFVLIIFSMIWLLFRAKMQTLFRRLAFWAPFNVVRIILLKIGGVSLGFSVKVSHHVQMNKNVVIGNNSSIGSFTTIGPNTVISSGVFVGENSLILNTKIGNNTRVNTGSQVIGTKSSRISIGDNSTIGYYSILDGSGGLTIGDFVHIASPSVGIWTHSSMDNALNRVPINDASYQSNLRFGEVSIGDNVWIGGNSTIYPETKISKNCVVLSNSVVNKNLFSNFMYGGSPVTKIRDLKENR